MNSHISSPACWSGPVRSPFRSGRHGWPTAAHAVEHFAEGFGGVGGALINTGAGAGVGIVAGAIVLAAVMGVQKLRGAH